jgi:hypothetical protein
VIASNIQEISEIASLLVLRKVRFQAEDSLFNILVLIRFPPEIRLAGIPNCLQSCILHLDFSRCSPLTDAVTVFITVRASLIQFQMRQRIVYDFWLSPGIFHPTGNKSDIKRERLGPNIYASHIAQVLEKTQIDAYINFVAKYPDIKIGQRTFDKLKPLFVRPA